MAQGEGHRDAPVIRGNATTADFYIDGVRDDVQYYRDVYNIERVEAKGSQRTHDNSNSFRHYVSAERYGIAPTAALRAGDRTSVRLAYERFHDGRTVDRGIPSYNGVPSGAHRSTYFGDPDNSFAAAGVHLGAVAIDHQLGVLSVRNTTTIGDYDKFYQNVFSASVNADQTLVALSAYSNRTFRRNAFNQTDWSTPGACGTRCSWEPNSAGSARIISAIPGTSEARRRSMCHL
jgi:catecholate siderophore receptor